MSTISSNNTNYTSNYKCSYCGSSNVQYKAKEDTIMIKTMYPFLCDTCYKKTNNSKFYYKLLS